MAAISLQQLSKRYGANTIVDGLDLDIAAGEFMVLVGPSGCGKSTTLRMIAGLEEVSSGRILIDGRDVTDAEPHQRDIAMVFQSYALYPHMTVEMNMAFGLLRTTRLPKSEVRQRVQEAADRLQITELLARKPGQLSGGQRQRVAIGRALVRKPKVFLFDEPLSNLDAKLRNHMRAELEKLHAELGITIVYVTHDQVEAMTLGTRIAVMQGGRIQQLGEPMQVYRAPASRFVASFIGSPEMNFLPASASVTPLLRQRFGDAALAAGARVGLRPEDLHVEAADAGDAAGAMAGGGHGSPGGDWDGVLRRIERLGADALVEVDVDGCIVRVRASVDAVWRAGQPVRLHADPARLRVFDAAGAALPCETAQRSAT